MSSVNGVPILGAKQKINGGQEYAARLTTTDGDEHILCVNFNLPVGPDGLPDLAARAAFDPEAQVLNALTMSIAFGLRLPIQPPPGFQPQLVFPCEGGARVMPAHVVSFRYLGPVEERPDARTLTVRQDGRLARYALDGPYPTVGRTEDGRTAR